MRCPALRAPRQSATASASLAWRSAGIGLDWLKHARGRLCPSDQPLCHSVCDRSRIVARLRALLPDLLKAHRDTLDPAPDERRVSVAEIFRADVDDATGVDHVIGRVEDAAGVKALAVF